MKLGVFMFPTDTAIQPIELGRAVEERGFESLWFPEHSHIPTSRKTPWGGRPGAKPLPEEYWHTHDQLIALAAVAATTSSIRLGTGITLVAQRDPIWLAKEIASLDHISAGRVIFGIGYGWNKEEMAHHGLRYSERRAILREKILAMKALWTQDDASFEGRFVRLEPSWAWPKPLQRPHPPIVMGAAPGAKTFGHVIEFCDGWMPIHGRYEVVERIDQLRQMAEDAGRDPDSIELGVTVRADPELLESLARGGIERAVLPIPPRPADEVIPRLDRYAALLDRFSG